MRKYVVMRGLKQSHISGYCTGHLTGEINLNVDRPASGHRRRLPRTVARLGPWKGLLWARMTLIWPARRAGDTVESYRDPGMSATGVNLETSLRLMLTRFYRSTPIINTSSHAQPPSGSISDSIALNIQYYTGVLPSTHIPPTGMWWCKWISDTFHHRRLTPRQMAAKFGGGRRVSHWILHERATLTLIIIVSGGRNVLP